MRVHELLSIAAAAVLGSFAAVPLHAQEIQPAPLITEDMAVEMGSGPVSNEGETEAVVFSDRVFIPGAAALRLTFDEVELAGFVSDGSGSYLRLTSILDGGQQRLNALHVEQWRRTSAYFNGDEVLVELVAQPGTGVNELTISIVQAQFEMFVEESICDSIDDRLPSTDNRAARLLPIGCTGWLINDCNNCFITAGHCSTSNNSVQVVEFNVPLSNAEGGLNHPPPEDQYAVDVSSRQSNNGQGVGNDYAYFGVFANSNTGLTPFESYGDAYELATPPPVQGQDIRITGYGTTGNGVPREWNQAQKTHTGPYWTLSGSSVGYRTDTTGGNSGSPIIDESTGFAIGVHTHGGCGTGGSGNNWGTGLNNQGFQNFLNNPRGVCECPTLTFFFPDGLPTTLDPAGGTTVVVEVLGNGDTEPEPGTGVLYYDIGSGFESVSMAELSENVYEAAFPATDCGTTVAFYFSADATDGETVFEPRNAPNQSYAADATLGYALVFEDDFETDTGWTVENIDLLDGQWDRGVPIGGGNRGDPEGDFDGSGSCWLTDNVPDNSDVDGGPTRLTSPAIDLSGSPQAVVSYARWFTNDDNDADRLDVEVSDDDGATWALVESVPNTFGWVVSSFSVADFVATSETVRVRFSATDNPNDSVTEAAIDAFRVFSFVCADDCTADFNGDGNVDTLDVLAFLNAWTSEDESADINGDGEINTIDVLEFLNAWNEGC